MKTGNKHFCRIYYTNCVCENFIHWFVRSRSLSSVWCLFFVQNSTNYDWQRFQIIPTHHEGNERVDRCYQQKCNHFKLNNKVLFFCYAWTYVYAWYENSLWKKHEIFQHSCLSWFHSGIVYWYSNAHSYQWWIDIVESISSCRVSCIMSILTKGYPVGNIKRLNQYSFSGNSTKL
jgi:hypothetical protein